MSRGLSDVKEGLPKVIVRAFADEPVVLVAHRLDQAKNRVFVGQPDADRPTSLSCDDVFDYEETLFRRLTEAYQKKDGQALQELYASIKRQNKTLQGSCNKYQDALISAHEEKGQITNSRSAA